MARRRKSKKGFFAKLFVFLMVCLFTVLFIVMQGQDPAQMKHPTEWGDGTLLLVADKQVDYREGLVYMDAMQANYEQFYGEGIWEYVVDEHGSTLGEVLKSEVLHQMRYIKVICQKASELGIVLSSEELAEVDKRTREYMKTLEGSPLLARGVNEEIVRRIYSDNLLARKTFEVSTLNINTDVDTKDVQQRRFFSIGLRNHKVDSNGNKIPYEGEEKQKLMERMELLQERILNRDKVEAIYQYAASITEDLEHLELSGGKGDFSPEYEEYLLALTAGEVSQIVETADYLYIFYCVTDYDKDATLVVKEKIIAQRRKEEFLLLYHDWEKSVEVQVNEALWKSMNVTEGN